jgi:hypothetical protein
MKTLLTATILAASLVPMAAQARVYPGELQRDRQDIREERRDLNRAYRYGDRRDIRDERQDLREARREYREDLNERWRDGRRYHGPRYGHYTYRGGYRLPYSYGHRWERRHHDVVLINLRNGRVVRVIHNYYG